MDESYKEQLESELKRVDHLFYVSLKYTRTVDVLKNTILRLISCFDHAMLELLENLKEKNTIIDIPLVPGARCELLKDKYKDDETMQNYFEFYLLLRRINRAKYEAYTEFRRNVMMVAHLDTGEDIEVSIDIITEYYAKFDFQYSF